MATVTISQGKLKGSKCYTERGTEYFEFLGIPYAEPPVGNLRFKSPQPPKIWNGVRDATTVSLNQVACQLDLIKHTPIGTEDCLYLNVYTPNLPTSDEPKPIPVMFHIHGGGFLHGNGIIKSDTGPDFLIDNNVVVVSINYRLGVFGFLSLDIPDCAGNMGLKDQLQALIWVQGNIDKFGGDKNNVTIFGISAGSASVEFLMLSPKSKGLFHKAIMQSGSSLNHWAINFEPHKLMHKLLHNIGYKGSIRNHQNIYEFLMTYPQLDLMEESFKLVEANFPERLFFGFIPTIEKDFENGEAFLTSKPYKLLKHGNFNQIPVIKGFCEREGYIMSLIKPAIVEELNKNENFTHHWAYSLEENDQIRYNTKLKEVYIINDVPREAADNIGVEFFSDYDFISGIWLSSQFISDHGNPVYVYKFSYDGKINYFKNAFDFRKNGAAHADDVTYVFKNDISKFGVESDFIVRDKITKMWTNFAKTSIPVQNCSDLPVWPSYTRDAPVYLNIDKAFSVESQDDTSKMEVFNEIYDKYQM